MKTSTSKYINQLTLDRILAGEIRPPRDRRRRADPIRKFHTHIRHRGRMSRRQWATKARLMAAPGYTTLVLWSWPEGKRLSLRHWNGEPRRDVGHPMEKHRFLVDVPANLAAEIVRMVPLCELLDR
jgi:hypothetical protein